MKLRFFVAGAIAVAACDSSTLGGSYSPPALADGGGAGDAPTGPDAPDAGDDVSVSNAPCTTTFRFVPPPGTSPQAVQIAGEWNSFTPQPMSGPDADGAFTAHAQLSPGLVAYKIVVDGQWQFDPGARLHKYVGSTENTAVRVTDCHAPTLSLASKTIAQGHFAATVAFSPGEGAPSIDAASVKVTLRHDATTQPVSAVTVDAHARTISVDAPGLADGKYAVLVDAKDRAGQSAKTLRLVFWSEPRTFDWRDSLIYMAMTDRFKDGDPSNDPPPTAKVDPRADWHGGDLEGVRQKIADGTFDKLGVRVLWLSPFHANPIDAFPADDGVHVVTGYHGYWPIKARKVEARIGGDASLKALVAEAHAHGIRVLQDFVVNHIHQDHEYFKQHPSWFRTGCVCGTSNCDWTTHRLDCMFASYLPDVNWTVTDVNEQWDDDAAWWADTYDIDGMRIDAVKHVEDIAIINLTARMRDEFEAAGTRFFMTGETAMGWSGDALADNQSQYDTISRYIGPMGLDGQFDFVLYHAAAYRVFAYDWKGLAHADYWTQASGWEYPSGAIMTPYVGSQDTARMVTLATYRGQSPGFDVGIAGNKWDNAAGPPVDSEPYQRQRLALAWLLSLPGAPMLYYGDEYGEWGGADPNNRVMWRGDSNALSADEQATLALVRALGSARRDLVALRRGEYRPVYATDAALVFARQAGSDVALVAMTRSASGTSLTASLPVTLPLADGAVLHDRLGGPDVTVASGTVTLNLGSRGVAVLAP